MAKKEVMSNASVAEAKTIERINKLYETFDLEGTSFESVKKAIDYAVEEVVDPENHEDAVLGTAFDFLSGYKLAQNEKKHGEGNNFMEIVEQIMLSDGTKAALQKMESMAKEGDGNIAFLLAEIYNDGKVCRKNAEEGAMFMLRAAELGHPIAKMRLGTSFLRHAKQEVDKKYAFDLFHDVALQNNGEAEMILSFMYHTGYGCKKNNKLAELWAAKAFQDSFNEEEVFAIWGNAD